MRGKGKIKTRTVILFIFLIPSFSANSSPGKSISDSLRVEISMLNTAEKMDSTFEFIRNNRKKLGNDYIPVLKEFAGKAKKAGFRKSEMKAFDIIGLQYRYDQIYDSAYEYHTKSLKLAIEENDSVQMFYNYNNLGQVFRKQDITELAIDYFHKALEISDATGNFRSSSFTMNALGTTHVLQKDYTRAMKYFQLSSQIAKLGNDNRTLAYNYGSMGEIFLTKGEVDSAMYYFQTSRDLLIATGSDEGMGVAEHLLGRVYLEKGDYNKAQEKFEQALVFHKKNNDLRYQSYCNCFLGRIATSQNQFNEALSYLDLAKTQAEQVNSLKNLMEVYTNFAETYKKLNLWEKAYAAIQQSHRYTDSIINEANNRSIQALEIQFDTQKKEQKIELLTTENELKNQRLRAGIILLAVLVVIIFMILYILQIRRKQANLIQNDLRQQVLRSQMNPHFIFNVLGSIQNFLLSNDNKKAAKYLSQFASLTRATLEYSATDSISLTSEMNMLRDYMELEKMRKPGLFDYTIISDENLESDFIQIPPMMIQPFIENAVKHGFSDIDYPGVLTLKISDKDKWIEFVIEDNGKGISIENPATNHRSMAMQIFEKRRKLIQQKHKKEFKFEIKNLKDSDALKSGVRICINVPVLDYD